MYGIKNLLFIQGHRLTLKKQMQVFATRVEPKTFFCKLKLRYLKQMLVYSQFSFSVSIALAKIFFSQIVINNFEVVGI